MGVPRHESTRINTKAHLTVVQKKADPGEGHLGLADPQVQPNLDGLLIFGGRIALIFLITMAKVSIHRDGGNRP
jgi:hypothetical protein